MDVVERIKAELGSGPVVLFVNIFEEPEIREELKRYSNWPTYPQLYVKGELVGGCDITLEMLKSGELKKLMTEAGAAQ